MVELERETLEVIKGDICQWLAGLLKVGITPDTFMEMLGTGVLVCKLAKLIQQAAKVVKKPTVSIPSLAIKCDETAAQESFYARDNTSNFISWCREIGVEEAVIFESEGLVLHKDEKRVILCLLDVARFAERVGIPPPQLVRMEKEIDILERKGHATPPIKGPEKIPEEKVMKKLKACTCPSNPLSVNIHGNGKFIISGGKIRTDKILHARLLSDRIMVRVGGGWDTLDHFLLEHDPCRIQRFISAGPFRGKVTIESKNPPETCKIIHPV